MPVTTQSLKSPSASFTDQEWRHAVDNLVTTQAIQIPDTAAAATGNVRSMLPDPGTFGFASKRVDLSGITADGYPFWAVEPLLVSQHYTRHQAA